MKEQGIGGTSQLIEIQMRPESNGRWSSSALSKILGVQSSPGWSGFLSAACCDSPSRGTWICPCPLLPSVVPVAPPPLCLLHV